MGIGPTRRLKARIAETVGVYLPVEGLVLGSFCREGCRDCCLYKNGYSMLRALAYRYDAAISEYHIR